MGVTKRSGRVGVWRRVILLGLAALVGLFLFCSPKGLLDGDRDPYVGLALLRTPTKTGAVSFLPPAVTEEGVVLAPLFFIELTPEPRVVSCEVLVFRDRDGDRWPGESEKLQEGKLGLLPRGHGARGPDGWSLVAPAEEAGLRFHVVLDLGTDSLSWQGVVVEAEPDDPRRAD